MVLAISDPQCLALTSLSVSGNFMFHATIYQLTKVLPTFMTAVINHIVYELVGVASCV